VTPFKPGDPNVKLDGKALKIISAGRPYQTQIQSGSGGRGLVVQDVHAPTDVVWDRILDYDHYADMVPKTAESENYKVIEHKSSRKDPLEQTIYTRMKVGFPMIKLEFFIKHMYYPSLNSLTWTLDYTKKSDFDDSCGYWFVTPHPDYPDTWTRIYYSVEVSMFDWIPKFIMEFLSSKALTDATDWVKKYSEAKWNKDPRRAEMEASASGQSSAMVVGRAGKVRRKRWGLFRLFKKKMNPNEALSMGKESSGDTQGMIELMVEVEEVIPETFDKKLLTNVGWIRIFLLTLVTVLAAFNVTLFLSA